MVWPRQRCPKVAVSMMRAYSSFPVIEKGEFSASSFACHGCHGKMKKAPESAQ